MKLLFESDRTFKLWFYAVSHSLLLLRSPKKENIDTRIDLIFRGVMAISTRTHSIEGLKVYQSDDVEFARSELDSVVDGEIGAKKFILETAKYKGFLIAHTFDWLEDDGGYADPNRLVNEFGFLGAPPQMGTDWQVPRN